LRKGWVTQATVIFGDDEDLVALAAKAGCRGVFIGFGSPTPEGLQELGKKFNLISAVKHPVEGWLNGNGPSCNFQICGSARDSSR